MSNSLPDSVIFCDLEAFERTVDLPKLKCFFLNFTSVQKQLLVFLVMSLAVQLTDSDIMSATVRLIVISEQINN